MKTYRIPFTWSAFSKIEVEAENLQEATEKAIQQFVDTTEEQVFDNSFVPVWDFIEEDYPGEELDFDEVWQNVFGVVYDFLKKERQEYEERKAKENKL